MMATETFTEGQTIYDSKGNPFVVQDGKPVSAAQAAAQEQSGASFTQDVKAGAVPWAAQGVEALAGTPGALTDLAGRGESWLGGKVKGYFPGIGDILEREGKNAQESYLSQKWSPEAWAKTIDPYVSGAGYDPGYEPQTLGGKFVRTGLQFAPSIAASAINPFGAESVAANLIRGAGSAIGSEALGSGVEAFTGPNSNAGATARMTGALLGGHMAPKVTTPFPAASQARVAAVDSLQQDIKPYGGNLDAADRAGSSRLRELTGPNPVNNNEAISQALLNKAGVKNYTPGQPLKPAVDAFEKTANQDLKNAKSNAWIVRDQDYRKDITGIRADANATYRPGSSELQEVEDALKRANKNSTSYYPAGTPQLRYGQMPGKNIKGSAAGEGYMDMKNEFLSSKNPHVQQVGQALEDAAHRTPGAPWRDIDERAADAARLQAGVKEAGPYATTVNPKTVAEATNDKGAAIRTDTGMAGTARTAAGVQAPLPAASTTGVGELAGPMLGIAANYLTGGGAEKGIAAMIAGGHANPSIQAMSRALLRTRPAQAYLGNQRLLPGVHYNIPGRNTASTLNEALRLSGPADVNFLNSQQQ